MRNLNLITGTTILVLFCFCSQYSRGQSVLDPREVVSKDHVRYSDLMWMKRVWRRIDLRQKLNHPLYFPESPSNGRKSFFHSIQEAVLTGDIVAYNPGPLRADDMLTIPYSLAQLDSLFNPVSMVSQTDPFTQIESEVELIVPLASRDIIMYELKEDWFFDRERSVMEVRIVAICPLLRVTDAETGEFRGFKRLFWIRYDDLRPLMVNWPVYTLRNDVQPTSFDDLFNKRMFEGLIVKESNVYDRYINQYAIGEDALLESERIEKELLEMEHDLWSY